MSAPVLAEETGRGLEIPFRAFRARVGNEEHIKKFLRSLTTIEKPQPGRPRIAPPARRLAYLFEGDRLIVPRNRGPTLAKTVGADRRPLIEVQRRVSSARALDSQCLHPVELLYDYQDAAVTHLCDGPLRPDSSAAGVAYLQMDTGLGKSRVGCGVVARLGVATIVVVPTDAIATQWLDEFAAMYPDLRVAQYHNPTKSARRAPPSAATHDVIVVVVNTFRAKTPEFLEGFGLTILDEAHEYHSPVNSQALWLAQTPAVLGLSATPAERKDGLDLYVRLHLGQEIMPATIPGFDITAVNFRGEVRIVDYKGHPDHCETATTAAGTMSAVLTVGNVLRDPARLRLVAAEVDRLFRLHETAPPDELARLGLGPRPPEAATPKHPAGGIRRHGVFVFAELREALPAIREALAARLGHDNVLTPELDDGKTAEKTPGSAGSAGSAGSDTMAVSILRGGVKSTAVGCARAAGSHVVLTTFGFSRRGISLPDMTAAVFASSRRNGGIQILGRIRRRGSDESILRQVVDIVDVCTGLKGQVYDRRVIYRKIGYPITKVAASWEDYAGPADIAPQPVEAGGDEFAEVPTADLLALALGD